MIPQISVVGVGICCQDTIIKSARPEWGGTAWIHDCHVQGGGLVGSALVACARLGACCRMYSLLGADAVAADIVAGLTDEGVDTSGVCLIPGGKSPFSVIHVDEESGERTIFHRKGVGLALQTPIDFEAIRNAQVVIVDDIYLELAISAAKAARSYGIPVVADLIPDGHQDELLGYVDVIIVPHDYVRYYGFEHDYNKALNELHSYGAATAVITLGKEGCIYSGAGKRGRLSAFAVDAVDTTGAGDAFHGAYGFAVAMGWDYARCCEFASAVAAIKCTNTGGRTALPTLSEVEHFLHSHSVQNHAIES